MSYLALYRKYRPNTFTEVVGQEYVLKVLKNSVLKDMVSHAYLFSGPRGTGKTSIAKLISKLINCENAKNLTPCEKCNSCLAFNEKNNPDIIEIDAASNNGVDEIREIRDKVSLMPALSKYKVYIIDEVHMLSTGAFNALLKTLEEPPKHVIFILATTEFYKVPETIVSRCQCFDFEKISIKDIELKLEEIVKKEKIAIDGQVLQLIAKYSNGGLRDAINMLDKLVCFSDNISIDDFYEVRGLAKKEDINEIIDSIFLYKINDIFNKIDALNEKGKNLTILTEELLEEFKQILIDKLTKDINQDVDSNKIYQVIDILNETIINMKRSSYQKTILEINILKIVEIFNKHVEKKINRNEIKELKQDQENISLTQPEKQSSIATLLNNEEIDQEIKQEKENKKAKVSKLSTMIEENRKIKINNTFATADKNILEDLKIRWINISEYLYNKEFSSIVSYLLDGNLRVAGEKNVIISVAYSSILENALVNLEKIELLLDLVTKKHYSIAFILDSEWEDLKNKYINDKKSGNIYKYQEEIKIDYDSIKEELKEIKQVADSKMVKEAVSLFGNDIVEIK